MSTALIDRLRLPGQERGWRPERLRALLFGQYALFGVILGLHSVLWSDVKLALGVGEGVFGTALSVTPLIGFVTLLLPGPWRRLDRRRLALAGLLAILLALLTLASAQTLVALVASRVLTGLGFALLDSAVTGAALRWEEATGRRLVSQLYAAASAGMLAGALGGGALLDAGLSFRAVLLVLVPLLALVAAATALAGYPPHVPTRGSGAGRAPFALVSRPGFLTLAALTLLGVGAEAVVALWGMVYLREAGADALTGSVVIALFNGALILGRVLNGAALARWQPQALLRLAAAGIACAGALVSVDSRALDIVGFGVLGLAVGGVIPTLLSLARGRPGGGGDANGIIATIYLAYCVTSPLVGWLAEPLGLELALPVILATAACGILGLVRRLGGERAANDLPSGRGTMAR